MAQFQVLLSTIPPHLLDEEKRKKPMDIKNMLIDIGALIHKMRENWALGLDSLLFPFVLSHRWQTRKRSWQKHGTIAMDVAWRLSCSKKCKMKHFPNILYSGATVREDEV